MGKTAVAVIALSLVLATACVAGEEEDRVDAGWRSRMGQVQADLDRAGKGYVAVMGDSNAARLDSAPCPGPFVNGGMGGIGARRYRELLDGVRVPDGGAAAILNVGTGDMVRKRSPMSAGAMAAYEGDVAAIVARLRPHVARVVVNALPPLGGKFAAKLDPEAVEAYSARLRELCGRIGCIYADPWRADRGASFGLARAGRVSDGLHPDDVRGAYASISGVACPARAAAR